MFDTEIFIQEIEKRPPLYDVYSIDYSNRAVKAACWSEVGEIMIDNWHQMTESEQEKCAKRLGKKWKALRDNFVRENRKTNTDGPAIKRKKYIFYNQLLFLIPYVKGHDNESQQEEIINDFQKYQQNGKRPSLRTIQRRRRQERLNRRAAAEKALSMNSESTTDTLQESLEEDLAERDKYGNRAFLISFLPIMDSLPQHLQLEMRMKVTEAFSYAVMSNADNTLDEEADQLSRASTPCFEAYAETVDVPKQEQSDSNHQ